MTKHVFQPYIRKVCLVGPSIMSKDGASSYLWVAHLTALYDKAAKAAAGAMRNPSLRVLAEAAEPRNDFDAKGDSGLFHDPKLLSVAVRPQVGWWSTLFFDALPSGQKAKAISGSMGNGQKGDAFSVVTAVPALAQTAGKWPDKTQDVIQVPPLRLTAGLIPMYVTFEKGRKHKNKIGYWSLLQVKDDNKGGLFLFGKKDGGSGVSVAAVPGKYDVLKDDLPIPDDNLHPNSMESGNSNLKKVETGDKPRFAVDLSPEGIEFQAKLHFKSKIVDVRLRLEARGSGNYVLVLLEDKNDFFRKGLDRAAADLRNQYPVVLDLRPGTPKIVWTLKYENGKLTLPEVRDFSLESDSVRISLLSDPPMGASGRSVARLANPQAQVTWGETTPEKIEITAGDEDPTAAPVALLSVGTDKRFEFLLGKSVPESDPVGDVTIIVDPKEAGSTGSVFLALERGVAELSRPSEVEIPAVGATNAFEGLVHLKSSSIENGQSTFTVDAATQAKVVIRYDPSGAIKVETKLFGAVGVLDGYVWATAGSPSGQEMVPTLDNGPISLRSLPLLFGAHELTEGYKGTIASIPSNTTPPVFSPRSMRVTIEAKKAVLWRPHPETMKENLPPVVAAVSMTRTVPNATEPSRTRDLVPVEYGAEENGIVKLLLLSQGGSVLPSGTIEDDQHARFGWRDADVPLVAVTLPGVEYAAEAEVKPKLRVDLPLLDEFHSSATPRRSQMETAPKSAVTENMADQLEPFWMDQSRRRKLMLSAENVFESVAMPFEMSDTTSFDVKNSESLLLGSYKIGDRRYEGEGALAGLSENYQIAVAQGSKLEKNSEGPIKVTGFAMAPYEVKLGTTRPAGKREGDAWQDTRGHAFAMTFTRKNTAVLRDTHFQRCTDTTVPRTLITSLEATRVQISNGVEACLAFRDLPTSKESDGLVFRASNTQLADPYGRENLPISVYEWRHYQVSQGNPAHDIGFGPLRLKPLRLTEASFDVEGRCKQAKIDYRVDLAEPVNPGAAPYGPDDVYRTGNVISMTYDRFNDSLKPTSVSDSKVQFFVTAKTSDKPRKSLNVSVSFGFTVVGNDLVIVKDSGELKLILFGSERTFTNATVTVDMAQQVLTIMARPTQTPGNLTIEGVTLTLKPGKGETELVVKASLSTMLVEHNPALVLHFGRPDDSVRLYGVEIRTDNTLVDHETGVVSVTLNQTVCDKALACGFPVVTEAKGSMVFVIADLAIGAARVDLHLQGSAFEAHFLMQVEDSQMTQRRLTLMLPVPEENSSIISWPIGAVSFSDVDALMSATSLAWNGRDGSSMIKVKVAPNSVPVTHKVQPRLKTLDLPKDALKKDGGVWFVFQPVRLKAVTLHQLKMGDDSLSWTSIDDVTLIDVNRFAELAAVIEAAKLEKPDLAKQPYVFSPRYRKANIMGSAANSTEVPIAGIVRTAPFGRAIGNYIQKHAEKGNFKQGLALVGGAVHEADLGENLALTFGLPWICFLEGKPQPDHSPTPQPAWPLPLIPQAPSGGDKTITVSLFDLPAVVPHRRSETAAYPMAVSGHRVVDLMAEMKRLKLDPAIRVADLAFASNLPAYPKKLDTTDPVDPDFETPIFWRTLMALKRLFNETKPRTSQSFRTVFGDPKAEHAVRIDLVASDVVRRPSQINKAHVFVFDQSRVEVSELPATLSIETVSTSDGQRRVQLDARSAIADPYAIMIARVVAQDAERIIDASAGDQQDTAKKTPEQAHHENGFLLDTIKRPLIARGRALRPEKDKTIYPDPSLGWPEFGQLDQAGASSLSIGEEKPIQDDTVAWAGRARRFSGTIVAKTGGGTSFLAVGRRICFARNAESAPVVTAPPDRALTPVPPRARAPLAKAIKDAFADQGMDDGLLGNFLPGRYELISTGVRPGAMVFEHTGVLHSSNPRPFDPEHERFGRPAEHAPVVWTQGRAPRSTGLPQVKDLDLRRRTFIGENCVDGENDEKMRELVLIQGPAAVIRYLPSTISEGGPSFKRKTVAIFVRVKTMITASGDFASGKIVLDFKRPLSLYDEVADTAPEKKDPNKGTAIALLEVLEKLGFIPGSTTVPGGGLLYSLTLGGSVVSSSNVFGEPNNCKTHARVTVAFDSGFAAIRQALVSATPDTRAQLNIRAGGEQSATEPPRTLSIRLPVFPALGPYLPIPTATLAFGDPAYDRELAGPTKTTVWRDSSGSMRILSLDRPAYNVGDTVYFAGGKLNPDFLDPKKQIDDPSAFESESGTWIPQIEWLPKKADDRSKVPLTIAYLHPVGEFEYGKAYGVSIASLRMNSGASPTFQDGDRLIFTMSVRDNNLAVSITIVDEPVIAPSPAVYSLVTLDKVNGKEIATPILFTSAPLPTTLEFPDLLNDLAKGHVRRRGLFVWQFVPRTAKPTAALVKIDRTGGGQIPSKKTDFVPLMG